VTGLAVDGANRLLLSAGYDGMLRTWLFRKHSAQQVGGSGGRRAGG
jgi:hypothetical protein